MLQASSVKERAKSTMNNLIRVEYSKFDSLLQVKMMQAALNDQTSIRFDYTITDELVDVKLFMERVEKALDDHGYKFMLTRRYTETDNSTPFALATVTNITYDIDWGDA